MRFRGVLGERPKAPGTGVKLPDPYGYAKLLRRLDQRYVQTNPDAANGDGGYSPWTAAPDPGQRAHKRLAS